ncbi:MAG: T9SS type A sorting domain-containing protein, partial [Bacteroidia bacterium]
MKKHILIALVLCSGIVQAQTNLIFGGGDDDGYSEQRHSQSENNPIFSGGNRDGYTENAFSQPTNNAVFGGGDDDGYSEKGYAQPENNSIFLGGDDDGFAEKSYAQASNSAIFGGGDDDGYSEKSFAQANNNSIFGGGDDDGYVCFYLETALPLRLPPTLAVNWLSFDARPIDAKVRLLWETGREENHHFFQVERSADLLTIESVGEIIAAQGSATTGGQYRSWDERPLAGSSFYRVKAVDNNGEASYSEWEEIHFGASEELAFVAFPNPVQNVLTIRLQSLSEKKISIRLTDVQGKLLRSEDHNLSIGETSLQFDMRALAEGLYFIEVYAENAKRR